MRVAFSISPQWATTDVSWTLQSVNIWISEPIGPGMEEKNNMSVGILKRCFYRSWCGVILLWTMNDDCYCTRWRGWRVGWIYKVKTLKIWFGSIRWYKISNAFIYTSWSQFNNRVDSSRSYSYSIRILFVQLESIVNLSNVINFEVGPSII